MHYPVFDNDPQGQNGGYENQHQVVARVVDMNQFPYILVRWRLAHMSDCHVAHSHSYHGSVFSR